MQEPAPKGIVSQDNTQAVHLPTHEANWRKKVAQHARKFQEHSREVRQSLAEDEFAPVASQPIPKSSELEKVNAERVGEESALPLNLADFKHNIDTTGAIVGGANPDTYDRASSGKRVVRFMKERMKKMWSSKRV